MFRTALATGVLLMSSHAFAQPEPVGDRVEVNGMQVNYETFGQGDPMIVLRGAYMNIPSMVAMFRLLGGGIMGDMGKPLPVREKKQ